jgi:hypothetical protein
MVTLLKFPFFSQVSGQIEKFTDMPLDGRKAPRKIKTLAMRPLAMGRRRLQPIPGELAALPAGVGYREVGGSCRCLNLSTSMGGTRSKVEGGDRHDLEPEGTSEDTRHEIYTGSGSRSSYPTSCLE